MDEIKNYLVSKNKSYSEGIDLLKKYSKNEKETAFLATQKKPLPMHENMLIKRLSNILRISLQNQKPEEKVEKAAIKTIKAQKTHFSKVTAPGALTQTKELTNKLLAREWNDLDEKEQAYFKNNAELFASKKGLFFRNSAIESELKSLHASLEHLDSDEKRKEVAENVVNLKKEQNDNWAIIDNFDTVVKIEKVETKDKPSEAELVKMRNNLRSRVSKLEKQVAEEPEHKNFEERKEKLELAKAELDEVEKALSV
jgi:hypothetical protein